MSNPIQDAETFISDELKKIVSWVEGEEKNVAPAIALAENALNAIKSFEVTPEGETIEAILEAVIPASTGLVVAFNNQLPVWLADLGLIDAEAGKNLSAQVSDAVSVVKSKTDSNVVSVILGGLKSLFTTWFADNLGTPITIQQAQTLSQPTHVQAA